MDDSRRHAVELLELEVLGQQNGHDLPELDDSQMQARRHS